MSSNALSKEILLYNFLFLIFKIKKAKNHKRTFLIETHQLYVIFAKIHRDYLEFNFCKSYFQEPASIRLFVTWPLNTLRNQSCTQWSNEMLSSLVFPHHHGISHDHFTFPLGNLFRSLKSSSTEVFWEFTSHLDRLSTTNTLEISLHLNFIGKSHGGVTERTRRVSKTPPQRVVLDPKPAVAYRSTKTLNVGTLFSTSTESFLQELFPDLCPTSSPPSSTNTDLLDVNFRVSSTRQRLLKQ